jgi:multiple sugar transport system permease protein
VSATHTPPVPVAPAARAPRRVVPRAVRRRRLLVTVAEHSVLIAAAIAFVFPFAFMVLTALMTTDQALSTNLWPDPFQWSNFKTVFDEAPMFRYALNTLIYSGLATLGMLVGSIPVAYALSILRWRGRDAVFLLTLVAMMLPPQVTIVPLYSMWAQLDLVGTLAPLIIPNWFGDAFSIFLLRQFFLTIPPSYIDSARIDGASELRILTSVVMRLAKPAIAAVALFMFLFTFSDFFGPLIYAGDEEANWTLSLGLAQFRTLHAVQWNLTLAATVLVMLPVIVLFFFAQKAFVEGVTLTGVKE